jgi:phosphoribosyl 1,2-cyclic phosphodiesterase
MIIRCWGSRGSIPVSGAKYLRYGGDTTCMEIRNDDGDVIIIDAGSGIRRLGNALIDEGVEHLTLLFTHAHWDHMLGFPFFKPIYNKNTRIELYGCPFAQKRIESLLEAEMAAPFFPISYNSIAATVVSHGYCDHAFTIGGMEVTPILISHPNQGIGYKFSENGKSFVFLTDNELAYSHENCSTYDEYLEFCRGVDLLIHDAEFTRAEYEETRGWGHSTYEGALRLAMDAEVKSFGLFHHNQERSDAAIDEFVAHCHRLIVDFHSHIECFAVACDTEVRL